MGGKLFVESNQLFFEPNVLESVLQAQIWNARLSEIDSFEVAAPGFEGPFRGAFRERLMVRLEGGGHELFVVRRPEEVASALSEILSQHRMGVDRTSTDAEKRGREEQAGGSPRIPSYVLAWFLIGILGLGLALVLLLGVLEGGFILGLMALGGAVSAFYFAGAGAGVFRRNRSST